MSIKSLASIDFDLTLSLNSPDEESSMMRTQIFNRVHFDDCIPLKKFNMTTGSYLNFWVTDEGWGISQKAVRREKSWLNFLQFLISLSALEWIIFSCHKTDFNSATMSDSQTKDLRFAIQRKLSRNCVIIESRIVSRANFLLEKWNFISTLSWFR